MVIHISLIHYLINSPNHIGFWWFVWLKSNLMAAILHKMTHQQYLSPLPLALWLTISKWTKVTCWVQCFCLNILFCFFPFSQGRFQSLVMTSYQRSIYVQTQSSRQEVVWSPDIFFARLPTNFPEVNLHVWISLMLEIYLFFVVVVIVLYFKYISQLGRVCELKNCCFLYIWFKENDLLNY